MIPFIAIHLSAPLIAFGGAMVDNRGVIRPFPALSMVTGLLANALGYRHADGAALQRLQDRLQLGVRCDYAGDSLCDFQTVQLDQDFLNADKVGWTTRGAIEARGGGEKKTHLRYRDYWADASYTAVVRLNPAEEEPCLEAIADALQRPARPLFIGRKNCLPTQPLFGGIIEAESLEKALHHAPLCWHAKKLAQKESVPFQRDGWLAVNSDHSPFYELTPVCDERDWSNQIHCGRRYLNQISIEIGEIL